MATHYRLQKRHIHTLLKGEEGMKGKKERKREEKEGKERCSEVSIARPTC